MLKYKSQGFKITLLSFTLLCFKNCKTVKINNISPVLHKALLSLEVWTRVLGQKKRVGLDILWYIMFAPHCAMYSSILSEIHRIFQRGKTFMF